MERLQESQFQSKDQEEVSRIARFSDFRRLKYRSGKSCRLMKQNLSRTLPEECRLYGRQTDAERNSRHTFQELFNFESAKITGFSCSFRPFEGSFCRRKPTSQERLSEGLMNLRICLKSAFDALHGFRRCGLRPPNSISAMRLEWRSARQNAIVA